MSKIRLGMLVLLALVIAPLLVQAQDATEWPPDPETIFAPGVEVVEVKAIKPFADNQNRVLYIYEGQSQIWRVYPFPPEIGAIRFIYDYGREDGKLGVGTDVNFDNWLVEPDTGEFVRLPNLCKERYPSFDLWVFYIDSPDGHTYLCNTETGRLSSPMPENITISTNDRIFVAPDYLSLVFTDRDQYPHNANKFYAYNIHDNQFLVLGTDKGGEEIKGVKWIENNHVVIRSGDMPSWGSGNYYIANVNEPQSLTYIQNTSNEYPLYYSDELKRYKWIDYDASGCNLVLFNPIDTSYENYPLDEDLCSLGAEIPAHAGDQLYLVINRDNRFIPISVSLVRYNPFTRERTDLFTGEIELWTQMSPDGKYINLVLDDNGLIDTEADYEDYDKVSVERLSHPQLAIFDLERQTIVYQIPVKWEWMPQYFFDWFDSDTSLVVSPAFSDVGGPTSVIVPLGKSYFVQRHLPTYCPDEAISCPDTLISINDDQITETGLPGSVEGFLSESGQLLLNEQGYQIYNLATGSTAPVFLDGRFDPYRMFVERIMDGNKFVVVIDNAIAYTVQLQAKDS